MLGTTTAVRIIAEQAAALGTSADRGAPGRVMQPKENTDSVFTIVVAISVVFRGLGSAVGGSALRVVALR